MRLVAGVDSPPCIACVTLAIVRIEAAFAYVSVRLMSAMSTAEASESRSAFVETDRGNTCAGPCGARRAASNAMTDLSREALGHPIGVLARPVRICMARRWRGGA